MEAFNIVFKNKTEHQTMQKFLFSLGCRWCGDMEISCEVTNFENYPIIVYIRDKSMSNQSIGRIYEKNEKYLTFTINDLDKIEWLLTNPSYEIGDVVQIQSDSLLYLAKIKLIDYVGWTVTADTTNVARITCPISCINRRANSVELNVFNTLLKARPIMQAPVSCIVDFPILTNKFSTKSGRALQVENENLNFNKLLYDYTIADVEGSKRVAEILRKMRTREKIIEAVNEVLDKKLIWKEEPKNKLKNEIEEAINKIKL